MRSEMKAAPVYPGAPSGPASMADRGPPQPYPASMYGSAGPGYDPSGYGPGGGPPMGGYGGYEFSGYGMPMGGYGMPEGKNWLK